MKVSDVQYIKNKTGTIWINGLSIEVTILDIREVWGTIHYLITPIDGSGSVWVNASRVKVNDK